MGPPWGLYHTLCMGWAEAKVIMEVGGAKNIGHHTDLNRPISHCCGCKMQVLAVRRCVGLNYFIKGELSSPRMRVVKAACYH